MRRTLSIVSASLVALAISTSAQAQSNECGPVTITQMDWASAEIVGQIATFLMEQGYGCDVQQIPTSTDPALTSLAENGEPDIATELWTNNKPEYFEMLESGKVREAGNVLSEGGEEGWFIPTYIAEAHPEIRTVEDALAHPEIIGNRFHNCPEGWGCRTLNDTLIRAWNVGDHVEIFNHGSGETLATSIASAYEDRAPWFGYYWGPTSILGRYDMTRLDMGEFDQDAFECAQQSYCENPRKTSFPTSTVVNATTEAFAEEHPDVFAFLQKMSFTNDQMSSLLSWMDENNATAEEAAVHFLTTQQDLWRGWVSEDAQGRLAALLQ